LRVAAPAYLAAWSIRRAPPQGIRNRPIGARSGAARPARSYLCLVKRSIPPYLQIIQVKGQRMTVTKDEQGEELLEG
jgi:hypothetical protein